MRKKSKQAEIEQGVSHGDPEWMLEELRTKYPETYTKLVEENRNPEYAKREKQEQLDRFLNSLVDIPAGYELPAGFAENWEELLHATEESHIKAFINEHSFGRREAKRMVKRGWTDIGPGQEFLRFSSKKPEGSVPPVPVVVFFESGNWIASPYLSMILQDHPVLRAFKETLPRRSEDSAVKRHLEWARTLHESENPHEQMLFQKANFLDLFLNGGALGDSDEMGWINIAETTQPFWEILDAAFQFGQHYGIWQLLSDGNIKTQAIKALIPKSGKPASDQRFHVEEAFDAYVDEKGKEPTPIELLKWLGGTRPSYNDGSPLIFAGSNRSNFEGVTWLVLREMVKSIKRRGK